MRPEQAFAALTVAAVVATWWVWWLVGVVRRAVARRWER